MSDERDAELWRDVGRSMLFDELAEARFDLETAFHDAEDGLHPALADDEFTAEDVQAMRRALTRARRVVERYAAPAAGLEPFDGSVADMTYGEMKEVYRLDL